MDRSLRSVFVGNIPYEATEEQLKDILSEVGPVASFRLVFDKETGKPKGYGFCEYPDEGLALSAKRNLNGREVSGRALRVDSVATEKKEESKDEGPAGPSAGSPYGDPILPEEAPESITRAVASLPPEQIFELVKQMKHCVQNSPQEARNMLLQNPQLAYALLQAQVLMRIIDPETARKVVHPKIQVTPLVPGQPQSVSGPGPRSGSGYGPGPGPGSGSGSGSGPGPGPGPGPLSGPGPGPGPGPLSGSGPGLCPGPAMLLNQQHPPAPWPENLAKRPRKDVPPLMQTSTQGAIPAPELTAPTLPGPGPASLTPAGAVQTRGAKPALGLVPLERGQVQMADPLRGPMTAAALPPRGPLGNTPNDPLGGTLVAIPGQVKLRGPLAPPRQAPPGHSAGAHEKRGPSVPDLRGGPIADAKVLRAEPRGSMTDQRGLLKNGTRGRVSGGMESGATETGLLESRGTERRGMATRAVETRRVEARGTDARGLELRGPAPSSTGPMPGGMQGRGPIKGGKRGPWGQRQVPSISGVGNPRGGTRAAGMPGAGMPRACLRGASTQGVGAQGASKQDGGQPSSLSPGQSQESPEEREKADLVRQVLQLTADQIAMLPPEHRQSMLDLKEQLHKSMQRLESR